MKNILGPTGAQNVEMQMLDESNAVVNLTRHPRKDVTLATTGPTVADALQQLEVTLGAQDRVNPAPETPLTEGLAVTINRKGVSLMAPTRIPDK